MVCTASDLYSCIMLCVSGSVQSYELVLSIGHNWVDSIRRSSLQSVVSCNKQDDGQKRDEPYEFFRLIGSAFIDVKLWYTVAWFHSFAEWPCSRCLHKHQYCQVSESGFYKCYWAFLPHLLQLKHWRPLLQASNYTKQETNSRRTARDHGCSAGCNEAWRQEEGNCYDNGKMR